MSDIVSLNILRSQIAVFVEPALEILVTEFKSCDQAIGAGKQIKALIKEVEITRMLLVTPMNDEVKRVNQYAKDIAEPLLKAEAHIKSEIGKFYEEQEKVKAEEKAKLEELKRAEEAALKRQQDEEKAELKAELQATADLFGEASVPNGLAGSPLTVLETTHVGQKAAQSIEHGAMDWDIKQKQVKNVRKVLRVEVVDANLIPDEFLIWELNEKAALAAIKAGATIPGVRSWEETQVALGRNTYVPRSNLN